MKASGQQKGYKWRGYPWRRIWPCTVLASCAASVFACMLIQGLSQWITQLCRQYHRHVNVWLKQTKIYIVCLPQCRGQEYWLWWARCEISTHGRVPQSAKISKKSCTEQEVLRRYYFITPSLLYCVVHYFVLQRKVLDGQRYCMLLQSRGIQVNCIQTETFSWEEVRICDEKQNV